MLKNGRGNDMETYILVVTTILQQEIPNKMSQWKIRWPCQNKIYTSIDLYLQKQIIYTISSNEIK